MDDEDVAVGETSLVKAELLAAVERLGSRLPPNTLDQLIDELGGPQFVAEVNFPRLVPFSFQQCFDYMSNPKMW